MVVKVISTSSNGLLVVFVSSLVAFLRFSGELTFVVFLTLFFPMDVVYVGRGTMYVQLSAGRVINASSRRCA